jgi:predicted nucleotidyltransferase component of viral defense system
MNPALISMLENYDNNSIEDYQNALKEIVQEIALLGLWRSKFFLKAAFYGGSALRILYQLDRFSEDLDFSLLTPDKNFSLGHYIKAIVTELAAFGFEVTVEEKNTDSQIKSAFIKGNTKKQMLSIQLPDSIISRINHNAILKIKLELDCDPPKFFETEARALLLPIPFSVVTYSKPDMFAGKLHALLCRPWKNRVKGRDWYDMVWFIGRQVPVRLKHLAARMRQTKDWPRNKKLTEADVKQMLNDKIQQIDFKQAAKDILPFINDAAKIELWSPSFFTTLVEEQLRCIKY